LDFSYGDFFEGPSPEAYERLLLDAMKGDSTLFIRDDEIEAAWAFLEPVFDAWRSSEPPPLLNYEPGSWGPEVSDKIMISPNHKWHSI
jgi:glucose-6-phosphate 1-dehydrogenase